MKKKRNEMICWECKTINPENANYCRFCGSTLKVSCPDCGEKIEKNDNYCPYCGKYLKKDAVEVKSEKKDRVIENIGENDSDIPPFVTRNLILDNKGFKVAAFISYLALPIGIIVAIIAASLNVWLVKKQDILGFVNIVDYLAIVVLGYIATKGLKSFHRKSYISFIIITALTMASNIFRFIYGIDNTHPYDVRYWPVFSLIKFVLAFLLFIYFIKRDKYYIN